MGEGATPLFRQASRLYLVIAVAALCWIALQGRSLDPALLISDSWLRDLGWGLGLGAGLLLGWALARRLSRAARRLEDDLVGLIGPLRRDEAYALAGLSAIAEELLFRGAMLPAWGLIISTLCFGVLHLGPGRNFLWWTTTALLAGWGFGAVTIAADGALLAAMVAHALVNGVQLPRLAARAAAIASADPPPP
jgi:membrane protease YdiL (CAAX protease family)